MILPKNKILKTASVFLTAVLFSFLFGHYSPAKAQTGYLTVAPARQIIQADPGETKYINVKFLNQGDTPVTGIFGAADFIVTDKEGSVRFVDNATGLSSRYAAAPWAMLPYNKGSIAATDKVTLQIKVEVPENALPGGRYFGVYFEPTSAVPTATLDEYSLGTGVTTRLAGLVYLRISGPIEENTVVTKFYTPSFSEYGPIDIKTELLNRGNYHVRPQGKVVLYDMLGGVVEEKELDGANIFPDASMSYTNSLGSKYMVGKYSVKLVATYGETGKALTASTSFWAFPWRLALVIILTITIIILLITILYKSLKGRQKKLEAKLESEIKDLEELKEKVKDTHTTK